MLESETSLARDWSEELMKKLASTDFADLEDEDFWTMLRHAEVQQSQTFELPDVQWASTLSVEEGLALGLDDSSFRPGQAFAGKKHWAEVTGGNEHLMRWVQDGYSVYVKDFHTERKRAEHGSAVLEHTDFVTAEIQKLLELGVVEDITNIASSKDEARCVLSLVVAVNGEGKKRLCWNGKPANSLWVVPTFKLEGIDVALAMMQPGDFMFGLDLQKGYMQIPLKPVFKQFCCFHHLGRTYRYNVMPFGISTGPRDFSKLIRPLLGRWRAMGIRCTSYIDDFVFFASSMEEALRFRAIVLEDLRKLGWRLSVEKSQLNPAQIIRHLGFILCSVPTVSVAIPEGKLVNMKATIDRILGRQSGRCSGRELAVITGRLQSMRVALPAVALLTRSLYGGLASLFVGVGRSGYIDFDAVLTLDVAMKQELRFWRFSGLDWKGRKLAKAPVTQVLYTDASGMGYGGVLLRVLKRIRDGEPEPALMMNSMWEDVASVDSVYTELLGLLNCMVSGVKQIAGTAVLHRGDNLSTFFMVKNGGSRKSDRLNKLVRAIHLFCLMYGVELSSQYVGAGVIIKSGADMLSREADYTDCSLRDDKFEMLWRWGGPFDYDRFASGRTAKRDPDTRVRLKFATLFLDREAEVVDSLSQDWRGVRNYAFPPVVMILRVLKLVIRQEADTVLVVPNWPTQSWWPLLMQFSKGCVVLGNGSGSTFGAAQNGCCHPFGSDFGRPELVVFEAHKFTW